MTTLSRANSIRHLFPSRLPERRFSSSALVVGGPSPTGAVVFGHGLGDSPAGWQEPAVRWSRALPWLRFVLPPAPTRPVSLNHGMEMPAWYDIQGLGDRLQEPAAGIDDSRGLWLEHLERQSPEVGGRSRVVLGGFSQGGAMALHTALRMEGAPVAGVLCMSGYLPDFATINALEPTAERKRALEDLPVLLCHGTADPMVQLRQAVRTREALTDLGLQNVEMRTYEGMGHEICLEEIDDVQAWLKSTLPKL